jgi:hypothetical protein
MALVPVINPPGSEAVNVTSEFGIQTLAVIELEGLANAGVVSGLAYSNPGSSTNCKVILSLAPLAMASTGTVSIDNGTDSYELTVPSGTSGKRIEWNTIPSTFLASFSLINNLGVAFPATGNSLIIVPLY